MQNTVDRGFVSDWQMDFVLQSSSMEALLPRLIEAAGLSASDGLKGI
jgi:hypothetical protein